MNETKNQTQKIINQYLQDKVTLLKYIKGFVKIKKQIVAIKVIKLQTLPTSNSQNLLKKKINNITQLNHQNLIKVYDIFQTRNNTYIIYEFCCDRNLAFILSYTSFSIQQVIDIFKQISKGVKVLHIYIQNGIYKLSDFGLAIVKNEIQNIIKQFHCEISVYMAPETVQLNQYSEKSDIWSLGFVLYIMLFKELPFNLNYNLDFKTKQKQINEQTLPKQIKIILIGMLKIEPPKRLSIDSKLSYLLDQKKVQCNSDQNIFCQILRKSNSYANYHNSKHLSKTRPDELPQIDKQIVPNNIVDYKKLAQIRKQQIDFQKILI